MPLPLYRALLVVVAAAGVAGVVWLLLAQPAAPGLTIELPAAASTASPPAAHGPVDINTADNGELQRLHGIGPRLAERIIAYRTANGPFASVDGLLDVTGIGPATLEALRAGATVGATAASDTPVGSTR